MKQASFKPVGYVLLFLTCLLTGIITYHYVRVRNAESLDTLLVNVDTHIDSGNFRQAARRINALPTNGLNRYNMLRVIDRAYRLALVSGDWRPLERVSLRAAQSMQGNEEFWAFYVMALMRQGNYQRARDIAAERLLSSQFASIRDEALFRYSGGGDLAGLEARLNSSSDANFFEQVARDTRSAALFYNAALLHLQTANFERARSLLPFMGGNDIPSLGKALVAYDSGEWFLALNELENPTSSNLMVFNPPRGGLILSEQERIDILNNAHFTRATLLGDLRMLMGNNFTAFESYLQALSLNPSLSWRLWLNSVLLAERLGDNFNSVNQLEAALRFFPHQKYLTLALVERLPRGPARVLLDEFLQLSPNDIEANLFRMQNFAPDGNMQRISTELWQLFNYNSYSERLVQYMVWFFLAVRGEDDARLVLERFRGSNTAFIPAYQALIKVSEGSFNEALQLFSRLSSWEAFYNRGLIELYLRDNLSAATSFIEARLRYTELHREELDPVILANIEGQLAQAHFNAGQITLAREIAERALELDNDNLIVRNALRSMM
ncbi:MAG: hypothetical protein FWE37_07925 [Spirochaetaceae bacterium]|nr:hypothetical protein [Spirochaetaceae bacterium]